VCMGQITFLLGEYKIFVFLSTFPIHLSVGFGEDGAVDRVSVY
jgi:hypothetical protein